MTDDSGGTEAALRQRIEAEAEALFKERSLPIDTKPVYVAWVQHVSGLSVDQTCPYCGGEILVEDGGGAWRVACPCGRSRDTMRGL